MSSPEITNEPVDSTQSAETASPQIAESITQEPAGAPAPRPAPAPRAPFVPREERERRRREALAGLTVGEWREGKVTGIAQFGAFVDLGGVDGLVHVSQLGTGGYVERVEDVVQVGQVVRVRVAEVDLDRGRVSLSMREPRQAPAPRERSGAAPAPTSGAPRPPRPAGGGGGGGAGFTPAWTPETAPETRPDRRSRAPERSSTPRFEDRPNRQKERSRKQRDDDDQEWRSVRGDPRAYYSFEGEPEEEPAPTTAEELVARFGKKGTNR